MRGLLVPLKGLLFKCAMFSYYAILSYRDKLKTKPFSKIIHQKDFHGGKVLLLALYEKTELRNDVLSLLSEAKAQGVFIIAVNTLCLSEENYRKDLIDVYIERDNYGRDFGSYKAGMNYFYKKHINEKCERFLLLNDSVFFSKKGIGNFLEQLFATKVDVLGATENREISHHLGSFCISICSSIVNNKKFITFWEEYKNTNVRPFVIKRGEFKLSKILKSLARSENDFRALYDVNLFDKVLAEDNDLFQNYHFFKREGERNYWGTRSLNEYFCKDKVLMSFYNKYLESTQEVKETYLKEYGIKEKKIVEEADYLELVEFFSYIDFECSEHGVLLKNRLLSIYLDDFTRGSQIHNNCVVLHHIGLPIIKLDLLFRAVCNFNDLLKIRDQLDDSQKDEFMQLMTNRLSGTKFLFGMSQRAFDFGIL